jgi:hypothetical protein
MVEGWSLSDLTAEELVQEDIASLGWTLMETMLGNHPLAGKSRNLRELLELRHSGKHLQAIKRPKEADEQLFEIAHKMIEGKTYNNYKKLIHDLNVYLGEAIEESDNGPATSPPASPALPTPESPLDYINVKYLASSPDKIMEVIQDILDEKIELADEAQAKKIIDSLVGLYEELGATHALTEKEEELKQAAINLATEIDKLLTGGSS